MAHYINPLFLTGNCNAKLLECAAGIRQFVRDIGFASRQWLAGIKPTFSRFPIFVYRPAQRFAVEPYALDGLKDGLSFSVSVPRKPGRYPLIVWLKGKSARATICHELELNWVEAGYALIVISQASCPASFPERAAQVVDDAFVRAVRDLICHLRERDEPLLDRINFDRVVVGGLAIGANKAQTLANACASGNPPFPTLNSPTLLVIESAGDRQNSEDVDAGTSTFQNLVIALPGGGNEGIIRFNFHPLEGKGDGAGATDFLVPHSVAVSHLSLGYLDCAVKGDSTALEWLERDAGRWLEPMGDLYFN